jgi:hypothetical protein
MIRPKHTLIELSRIDIGYWSTLSHDKIHDVADDFVDSIFGLQGILAIASNGISKSLKQLQRLSLSNASILKVNKQSD